MIYILLPAYNEEDSIGHLFPKLDRLMKDDIKERYHIIICDDGSADRTSDKIERFRKDMPLTLIRHSLNRGLGETSRDLFEKAAEMAADSDVIVRMDCDDTHEPQYVAALLGKIKEGYDVVAASRFAGCGGEEGLGASRKAVSRLANIFMKIFFPIKDFSEYSNGFRAYRAEVIKKAIALFGNNFIQLKGLGFTCTLEKLVKLRMLGARFAEVPFVLKYSQKRSASKMITSVTTLGYMILVLLHYWPWGGWRAQYRGMEKLHNGV